MTEYVYGLKIGTEVDFKNFLNMIDFITCTPVNARYFSSSYILQYFGFL